MPASWLGERWRRRTGPRAGGSAEAARALPTENEKLWYLQHINIFADLTEADMRRLAQRTQMRRYERGKVIARPDDPPERGDIFGERALVGAQAEVHCEAFEDTLLCVLRRQDFEDLVRSKPELALRVMKVLAERLRRAEEAIENLSFRDVPERLATLLVRLAEAYGESHGQGRRLALRVTHQDLASMIGATRETVTNVLARFRDEGLIAVEDRHIVVLDLDRLRVRAE
ncbi:MAG: Crp/Fnr family transcriptional regulator [Armatimonadota bacterium]|nr:Crp/Fnr family transcriptional regulator [Armatimonadota bacterium]